MAKIKHLGDDCYLCGEMLQSEACFPWYGPPFSANRVIHLCFYCGSVVKPKSIIGEENVVDLIGTSCGDIYSLPEMIEQGFDDKKRLTLSIKVVADKLGLSKQVTRLRLKKE